MLRASFFPWPPRIRGFQPGTCFPPPATTARTRFRFGFHRRRRVLFAWLITFPKCGALPQNSHFSAIFLPASVFIWAWISCCKCRQTKLLILADPPSPSKYAFCILNGSSGRGFCAGRVLPYAASAFHVVRAAISILVWTCRLPVLTYGIATRAAYQ